MKENKLYKKKDKLVSFEFANRTNIKKSIWVEPACISIEVEVNMEYQILTHDKTFRIEFDRDETIIFYLQNSFGFILNKRPTSPDIINHNPWILELDWSDIN